METHISSINAIVQQRRSYFETGVTKSLTWRESQLRSLKRLLVEQEEALQGALQQDLSKGVYESYISEIGFVISEAEFALKNLKKWSKTRKVSTPLLAQLGQSYIVPEPLGTILIIGAWNYPVQLVLGPLVAALAAGNCAILKPSEIAVNCSKVIAELLPQYLDQDAVTVIQGGVEETTEILKQRYDHILYTGGEGVAKIVMRAAAQYLTPITLELGGKNPCIVDSNSDALVTAARIVWSKWMNVGQTCVAPDYVVVEQRYVNELIDALKKQLNVFYGNNTASNPDYGRIINQRHTQRLIDCLQGETIVAGGKHDVTERFIEPTIVLNPEENSLLMQSEIFGPILPIITVEQIVDALPIIKDRPKPLALHLYTKDKQLEHQVLAELSAGNVSINDGMMYMANPNLPFGGVGNSGTGRYHGQFGFDAFSHLKAVMKRATFIDIPLRYPPFTKSKLKIIRKLMK